jgi:hypothetical protein
LSGGQFTSFGFPKAVYTQPAKINTAGNIVGWYKLSDDVSHGFVLINGSYTAINFPNAAGTQALGMNDLGEIVGMYFDTAGKTNGFYAVKQ